MRDAPLSFETIAGTKNGTTILKLTGALTLSTMFPFQQALQAQTAPVLIMDMTDVPYVDSAGLGLIPNYYVKAQRDGRKLLLCGVNSRVGALLNHTQVDTFVKVYPTAAEAEASL
jgi:anti-anti-sigma factor